MKSVKEIGVNLKAIRDEELYRVEGYETFEKYLEVKLSMSRGRAYQLINAENVRSALADAVKGTPLEDTVEGMNENTLRAVARIEPERRLEVVQEAAKVGRPNGATIEAIAAKTGAIPASKIRQPKLKHICPKCGETF